jgi:hypothetical protein
MKMANVPGSGVADETPEIRGWRRSEKPSGAAMVMLAIVSPLFAKTVKKFCPFPRSN